MKGVNCVAVLEYLWNFVRLIGIGDVIDVVIVAFCVYHLINWLKQTRAMQLVKGIILIFMVMIISDLMNLTVLNYVINTLVQIGMFAIVVLFQPELRSLLESMGRSKVGKMIDFAKNKTSDPNEKICDDRVVR